MTRIQPSGPFPGQPLLRSPRRRRAIATAEKGGAKISEHRLENGLRVIVAERHTDPVVAVMTWYPVGARNEREDEAGVSHFLEHMMFKGSKRFGKGEVDQITTELGGTNNAFTGYDHTAYWFELASDRWERALEIEADRMRHLTIDEGEFLAEREVVLEELAMGKDDPWRSLWDLVGRHVFSRHPYRRPIIGYADVLRAMDVGGMRDYYRRFYHPGNATLVVAGDVGTKEALASVESRFGRIPAGPPFESADCFRPVPDEPPGEQRVTMTWDDQARRVCMAWPTGPVGSEDDFTLDVIGAVLTTGRMSRLYRRAILEEGFATSVSSHNDARVEAGVFWLFAECAMGVAPEALEKLLDEELERLSEEKLSAKELRRVRSMLAASEDHDSETASDLAEQLGEYACDADWQLAIDGLDRVLAVTPTDVRECARRLLLRERRTVGWCLPAPAKTVAKSKRPVKRVRRRSTRKKAARGGKR